MRWLLLPAAVLLGVFVGVCVVAVHSTAWGLVLGLATTAATLVALPAGAPTRLPFGLAWGAIVVWLSVARPEGDYLVASDAAGYVVLIAVPVVVVASALGIRRPRPDATEPATADDSGSRPRLS